MTSKRRKNSIGSRDIEPWLLFDMSYLCYRAFYSTPNLEFNGRPTGILYGVLRDISSAMSMFSSSRVLFCFDSGKSLRRTENPEYKKTRDDSNAAAREAVHLAAVELRRRILPRLGFNNVFAQRGYEADDIIAAAALEIGIKSRRKIVIISADQDLYQLLTPRCVLWNPRTGSTYTEKCLYREYGITPDKWADVKAIAGCSSDELPGIKGVGAKTAARFLAGTLKSTTKAFEAIVKGSEIWQRNLRLVRLPFEGCVVPKRKRDTATSKRWKKVMDELGIKTIPSPI